MTWAAGAALLAALLLTTTALASPLLRLNATTITKSGQWVQVSWSGVANATAYDAVALFPVGHTPEQLRPPRYQWVNRVPGWQSGSGSVTFQVLNHRADVVFYYFSHVTPNLTGNGSVFDFAFNFAPEPSPFYFSSANIVAKSSTLRIASPNEPTQLRLAQGNQPGSMLVQWTTRDVGAPTVQWGLRPDKLSKTVGPGKTTTYKRADLCGAPANTTGYLDPGTFNSVPLTGLPTDAVIYYRYGDAKLGWSEVASFRTAPAPGPDSTLRLLVWADSGQVNADGSYAWDWGDNNPISYSAPDTIEGTWAVVYSAWNQDQGQQGASQNLTDMLKKDVASFKPHALIHEGDISYARGSVSEWDQFHHQYEPIFKVGAYMTTPGNHECADVGSVPPDRYSLLSPRHDAGGECCVAYQRRFHMPQPQNDRTKTWYSFDMGPVHFVQISTETDFGQGSEQWSFVVSDLKAVNRSVTPWVVVGLHRPIYTSSLYGIEVNSDLYVADQLQSAFEEVFYLFEVDMTWNGHVHLYERTCPVYKQTCFGYNADGTAKAPVHLMTGNGGFEFTWFANPTPPAYFEVMVMEHGYNRITVSATTFHVTHISTENGRVIDDFKLTKPKGWQPKGFAARKHELEYFYPTYCPQSYAEWPGLSVNAIWGDAFFNAASAALLNTTLLVHVQRMKLAFVRNPNIQDTVSNLKEILELYYGLMRDPYVTKNSLPILSNFTTQVWGPVIKLFSENKHFWIKGTGYRTRT